MIDITPFEIANDTLADLRLRARSEKDSSRERIVIAMEGVLSHTNTAEFTDCIIGFFQSDWREAEIILELSGLQYISSSGIGAFTTIRMQADLKDSALYLLNMNSKVRKVFDQLGFTAFFKLIDSIEEIP